MTTYTCQVCGAELRPIPGRRGYFCPARNGPVHRERWAKVVRRIRSLEAGKPE